MRIGINATVFKNPVTGVAKRLIHLLLEMAKLDARLEFYLFSPTPFNIPKLEKPPFKTIITPSLYSLSEGYWLHIKIPKLLMKYQIDLFDAQWGGGLPYFLKWYFNSKPNFRRIKWLTTYHDMIPLEIGRSVERLRFNYRLFKNIKMADQVMVVSSLTATKLKQHIAEHIKDSVSAHKLQAKIKVSVNGLDEIFFASDRDHRAKTPPLKIIEEGRLVLEGTKPQLTSRENLEYFFYIGGFNQRKNLPTLLKAFKKTNQFKSQSDNNSKIYLVLAGKINDYFKKQLKPLIKKLQIKNIITLDYLKEEHLPTLYSHARVFIYPSLTEGFGMPVLEALSCHTPVIIHQALTPIFEDFNLVSNGFFKAITPLDLNDSEELANILIQFNLTQKDNNKTNLKSLTKKLSSFHWQVIAKNYLTNIKSIV